MGSEKQRHSRKRRKSSRRKDNQVKFSGKDICVPSSPTSKATTANSDTAVKDKPVVVENKILRYLTMLINYLRAAPPAQAAIPQQVAGRRENATDTFQRLHVDDRQERVNKNVMKPMFPRPDKYTSKSPPILEKRSSTSNQKIPIFSEFDAPCNKCHTTHATSPKAYDIVCAAIEYGLATGIVSKKGEYFWISQENCQQRRSLTPGYALREQCNTRSNERMENNSNYFYNEPRKISSSQLLVSPTRKSQDRRSHSRRNESLCQNNENVQSTNKQNIAQILSKSKCKAASHSKSRSRPRTLRNGAADSHSSLSSSVTSSSFYSLSPSPARKKQKKTKPKQTKK